MSKIGTTNIQNIKIGTSTVKEVRIGTSVYWSNVPKAMPPFNIDDWFISGGSRGTYGLVINSSGKLVQQLTAYATNWNDCISTSSELRTAKHITFNYTLASNKGTFLGSTYFIIEVKNGNTWEEVARESGGTTPGTFTKTLNVSTTATRMRIKVTMYGFGGQGGYGDNLNASITFNNINFS